MSFFVFNRDFYERFTMTHKWFFTNTTRASKAWFKDFRIVAVARGADKWNWGNHYRSPEMKNRFDEVVRQCVPEHQREYSDNLRAFDGTWDKSQWFTTNWHFLTQALRSDWNTDLAEVMDGWDDCYSTKECDEVANVLQASLYNQLAVHRWDLCRATGAAGIIELAGAAITIEGARRLFKSSGSRILALVASLAYPFAALVSNVLVMRPTIARITNAYE